jgi:uncharacterized protein with PIN domain
MKKQIEQQANEQEFVKYIGKHRKAVKGSKMKLKQTIGKCPVGCDAELSLNMEHKEKVVGNSVYSGRFFVYICPKCQSRWTTTESDTISIATLKPKKK